MSAPPGCPRTLLWSPGCTSATSCTSSSLGTCAIPWRRPTSWWAWPRRPMGSGCGRCAPVMQPTTTPGETWCSQGQRALALSSQMSANGTRWGLATCQGPCSPSSLCEKSYLPWPIKFPSIFSVAQAWWTIPHSQVVA